MSHPSPAPDFVAPSTPLVHSVELLEILEYIESVDPRLGPYFRRDLENALAGLPHDEMALEIAEGHQYCFCVEHFPSCLWFAVCHLYGCPACPA